MNITLSVDGIAENKVVFEKLLSKWKELFARSELLEEMESIECDENDTITFKNNDTEIRFYQTEINKAKRKDILLSFESVQTVFGQAFKGLYSIIRGNASTINQELVAYKKAESEITGVQSKEAVILTEIVYEVYAEKRISFVFSKFTDSNDVILHIEFSDDSSDTELKAKVIASSDEKSEITLENVLIELGKNDVYEAFSHFVSNISESEKRIKGKKQEEAEQEKLDKLQPAFEALNDL